MYGGEFEIAPRALLVVGFLSGGLGRVFVDGDEGPQARECRGHGAVADLQLGADGDEAGGDVVLGGEDGGGEVVQAKGTGGNDSARREKRGPVVSKERERDRMRLWRMGGGVGLQEPSAEGGDHDGFWLPRHLQVLDQEDGHGEEGDIGDDVDCDDGFPALELGGRRMVSRDWAWTKTRSVMSDLPDYCILNPMDIRRKSAE